MYYCFLNEIQKQLLILAKKKRERKVYEIKIISTYFLIIVCFTYNIQIYLFLKVN